jgi:hypothetical protein
MNYYLLFQFCYHSSSSIPQQLLGLLQHIHQQLRQQADRKKSKNNTVSNEKNYLRIWHL